MATVQRNSAVPLRVDIKTIMISKCEINNQGNIFRSVSEPSLCWAKERVEMTDFCIGLIDT